MCHMWQNEPQHTKSLARGEASKFRQGKSPPKASSSSGNKKKSKQGKGKETGKEKAHESANVLDISRLPELSITSSESINFSCYKMSEKVEWYLDSGSTEHTTPDKSNFVEYRAFAQAENAEIADGKFLTIEGYGTIIGHSIMLNGMASLHIQKVLNVPEANKH